MYPSVSKTQKISIVKKPTKSLYQQILEEGPSKPEENIPQDSEQMVDWEHEGDILTWNSPRTTQVKRSFNDLVFAFTGITEEVKRSRSIKKKFFF